MDVLILGGSGYIGQHLARHLAGAGLRPHAAARRGAPVRLDACDGVALTEALRRCDAVVNAVAGSAHAISEGARVLARAVRQVGGMPVVHLSSLAVLEDGVKRYDLSPHAGYVRGKREAEAHLAALTREGTPVTLLRPGCVWGPGSPLWTLRIADLLATGRLGDLGAWGDGWTLGVHVQDLCEAVLRLLAPRTATGQAGTREAGPRVVGLAAPDSPRWNRYLRDLALGIGATPMRRVPHWQLALDAWVAGPPLHALRRLGAARLPLPPSLLRQMRDTPRAEDAAALALPWTPYERTVEEAAASWRAVPPESASRNARAMNSGLPAR